MPVIDPVCGMQVEPSQTPYKLIYRGKVYYFCSPQCKKAFQENPDYYLEHGPQGMPGEGSATTESGGHHSTSGGNQHAHHHGHHHRHRDLPHGCGC